MIYLVYVLFTLSGFIALIYEATWARYLKLFLGHSSYGQILTLCIFMGGLGIGSFIAGKYFRRSKNPLLIYAVLEILIGIGGIAYHSLYLIITQLFYSFNYQFVPDFLTANIIKVTLSILITMPFAVLLGMTFPTIAIALMRILQDRGRVTLSTLYFTNSLGAAMGIMVTSYFLIPFLGTIGSLTLAGIGNIIIAAAFYIIAQARYKHIPPDSFEGVQNFVKEEITDTSLAGKTIFIWLSISFLTGFSSFLYEVGWIRLLSLLLGSSTHSFDIMVSAFILGLAFGGLYSRKLLSRYKNITIVLATVQILMGAFSLLSIYLYSPVFHLMNESNHVLQRTESAYYVFTIFKYLLSLMLMFPTSFFAGITLPLITYYLTNYTRNESYTGSVYGWNTIGSIFGAFCGGLILLPAIQLKFTIASGGIIDILIGLLLIKIYKTTKVRSLIAVVMSLFIVIPVFFMNFDSYLLTMGTFRKYRSYDSNEKITVRHGKTATIALHDVGKSLHLSTNGKVDASVSLSGEVNNDEYTQAALAFLPMSLVNKDYTVGVIGMGSGMTSHYLLGDELLKSMDLVEIEEEVFNIGKGFLPHNERVYNDPRVSLYFEDARTFFSQGNRKYDIIVSEPSNPWVSGVSNLFTKEFYSHIKNALEEDGFLAQWMNLYEFENTLLINILNAISSEFDYVKVYGIEGNDVVIIASNNKFEKDYSHRFNDQELILKDLSRYGDNSDFFVKDRYIISEETIDYLFDDFNLNSDYYPLVENGAELAFFTRDEVDMFKAFTDGIFYYQEVLEPQKFQKTLHSLISEKEKYEIDNVKYAYLYNRLKNADRNSDWTEIEYLYSQLLPYRYIRNYWYSNEINDLLREHIYNGMVPQIFSLKFLIIDNSINYNAENLEKFISKLVQVAEKDDLSPQIIKAIAIQSYKLNNKDLLNKVHKKYVQGNKNLEPTDRFIIEKLNSNIAQ